MIFSFGIDNSFRMRDSNVPRSSTLYPRSHPKTVKSAIAMKLSLAIAGFQTCPHLPGKELLTVRRQFIASVVAGQQPIVGED
jgi:hypothetical protein